MEWIMLGILAGALWLTVWGVRSLFRGIFGSSQKSRAGSASSGVAGAAVAGAGIATGIATGVALGTGAIGDASDEIDGMNEGDYHSGPGGYSPNTAYPETQYGSGFDEDAAWHEEQ